MITLESYIDNIDKLDILDEGTLENGSIMMLANEASISYRMMRKLQTNPVALAHQTHEINKDLKTRLDACNTPSACDELLSYIEKHAAQVQRKINGVEIKNKSGLKKMINVYSSYKQKVESKKNSL